jgi:hypothetical protein
MFAWRRDRHANVYHCSIPILFCFYGRNLSLMGGAIALSKQVKHRERSRKAKVSHRTHINAQGWQVQPIGRPKIVDDQYLERLKELVSQSPRQLGYPFQRWTANWLRRHLEQETGTVVSDRHINRLLKQMGLSTRSQPTICPTICHSLDHADDQSKGQLDHQFDNQVDHSVDRQIDGQLDDQPSGQPIDGQPIDGQPIDGQPIDGQPIDGQLNDQFIDQPDDSQYRICQRHTQRDGSSSAVATAAITIGDLHPSTTPKVLLLLD